MFKKINQILNIIMGAFTGVFIGHSIFVYWDYQMRPGLYAMQSAPWYTSIMVYGVGTAAVLVAGFAIKYILRKKGK